jgi:HK97 family phage major capsid protein
MAWINRTMTAEPIACIVPIAEDLLDDIDYDIWGEVKPALEESIAAVIDAAIFFGAGAPASWPVSIVAHAVAAGNTVNAGTGVDLAADLNSAMGAVEADGYYPDGWFYSLGEAATLRGLRDANRQFLFSPKGPANTGLATADDGMARKRARLGYQGDIWNRPAYTSALGLAGFTIAAGNARYVTGDFNQAIIGVRSDLKYTILKEATLYNPDGVTPMFALAQQDMVALRVVMRIAYQITNPITRMNGTAGTRSPFAVVRTTP